MKTITHEITVEISVDPAFLAKAFCEFDECEQAMFFNYVASESSIWSPGGFARQMSGAFTCTSASQAGRQIMKEIGEVAS